MNEQILVNSNQYSRLSPSINNIVLSNIPLALSRTLGGKGCFKTGLNRALGDLHTTVALSRRLGPFFPRRLGLALLETERGLIGRSR